MTPEQSSQNDVRWWIGSDHAGFDLKSAIQKHLPDYPWNDLGVFNASSADYPDTAHELAHKIGPKDLGVLICGSGVGISIAANRHAHIRCVLAQTPEIAKLAREHNHANVVALGARLTPLDLALKIISTFREATPDFDERHLRRIRKINP